MGARWAIPAAKSGAMVESAPTDSCGAEPSTANATVPAMNVYRPVIGGMPARRDVASCSGTAMASSVSPARRSGTSHWRR